MSEKDLLKENIKRENDLNKVILNLTQLEGDKNRLMEILQSLNVGEKRIYNDELESFVECNPELKEQEREEFLQLIDENKQIYEDIEKEVVEKLGIELEKVTTSKDKSHDSRKDFEDFQESFVELSLISSLGSISSSHHIIQQELTNLQVTPQNIDKVTYLLNKTEQESIEWLKYLSEQKKMGGFTLIDDKILNLYDATIAETQKTLEMVGTFKEKITEKDEKTFTSGEKKEPKKTYTSDELER